VCQPVVLVIALFSVLSSGAIVELDRVPLRKGIALAGANC
jgi:hypothetical protein